MADFEHILVAREVAGPRRRRPAPRTPPNRGSRAVFAPSLRDAVGSVLKRRLKETPTVPGVRPHLVVRMPLHRDANLEEIEHRLERGGVSVVATQPDKTIVAYNEDIQLESVLDDIERLERGPRFYPDRQEFAKSTTADYLFFIEPDGLELWERTDRVGPRLRDAMGPNAETLEPEGHYTVDVDLWFLGSDARARSVAEVETALELDGQPLGGITDRYEEGGSTVLRVAGSGLAISRLLDLDAVAEVDLPPRAVFSVSDAVSASLGELPPPEPPPAGGPSVCVLDTGVTAHHPLLSAHIGDAQSFLSSTAAPGDDHGHGTFVSAIAVFGDVRAAYERRSFESSVTLYSGKILNVDGGFDDQRLAETQIAAAVDYFTKPPYDCRVFNLSVGSEGPLLGGPDSRQSMLVEALDAIARRHSVLLVVSAGNHRLAQSIPTSTDDADRYPRLLLKPAAGLCEPATAAIPLTVGALAAYDEPDFEGVAQAVASKGEPSPFTRSGPGYRGAIKPDLADHGGNLIIATTHAGDQVEPNPATSVMSFSSDPLHELFRFDVGTSFSAPRVARLAALTFAALRENIEGDPDPNLVRAVLASAASVPAVCASLMGGDDSALLRIIGYGLPNEELAMGSVGTRATLIAQDEVPVDGFHIYAVPAPDAFTRATGTRRIDICVAHDPLVNRHRRDYLGSEMDFVLIRGRTLEEVIESVRHTDSGEDMEDMPRAFRAPWRVTLRPSWKPRDSAPARGASTLQKASVTWRRPPRDAYGETYYLVVRCIRRWMPRGAPQRYGLAVAMESSDASLHAQVRSQVQLRQRARIRPRRHS